MCDQLLTGERSIEPFIFGSSTPLTHALHMPWIGKMYRIRYCLHQFNRLVAVSHYCTAVSKGLRAASGVITISSIADDF